MSFRLSPSLLARACSLLLAVSLLLLAAPFQRDDARAQEPRQQQPSREDETVERVDTDLTTVLLTAVDKSRRFVTTLRQADVRVLEDGAEQQISIFQRETDLPLSLAIVVDTSKSQQHTLPEEKRAALAFINSVLRPAKDSAAVLSFTGKPFVRQTLTNDPALLSRAVESLEVEIPEDDPECTERDELTVEQDPRCWSAIWDAAWAAIDGVLAHTPPQTRRAIILLTDGYDTTSITKKDELIDFAVRSNAVIYAIGIGDTDYYDMDKGALKKISERTAGRAFFPETKAELDAAFAQINQELRSQYLIAYTPANRRRDGSFRRVKVELINPALKKEKLRLLYREGYYARVAATPAAKDNATPKN